MRFAKVTGTTAALLFLGTVIPAYAQRGEESGKQEERQGKPQQQQPAQQQQHAQQPQQRGRERPQQPQQRAQQPQQQQPQQRRQQSQQERAQQPQQRPPQERAQQPRQRPPQERAQQPQQRQPQERAQQPQQARQQRPPQRAPEQARAWQQQKGWVKQGGWQGHANFQQNRAQHWASEHRTWSQRGGYGGYYIPQAIFSLSFGRQHFFRLGRLPSMYMGYPRFYYGGFSFLLVDPWPEYWSDNWYSTDDVYVDYDEYDNGYYLYNRRYPEVRLAITVIL